MTVGLLTPDQPSQPVEPTPKDPWPDEPVRSPEQAKRHGWRYKEARRAGLSRRDAQLFASSQIDIEDMRRLARRGCPPHLILPLLLGDD